MAHPHRIFRHAFRLLPRRVELGQLQRMLWLSLVIGVPTGVVAAIFGFTIHECTHFFEHYLCGYTPPLPGGEGGSGLLPANPEIRRWALFFMPALGGLISGYLVYRFAPEAEGHGTDQVIDAFHHKQGRIRARVPIIKIITSAITIGSGGSAGREGPVAQVGAGVASYLAGLLRLSDRERRILLLTGVSAGIGSIFQAPLGAAFFAVEVLYRGPEFEFEALIPAFIASITSFSVYCLISGYGWGTIFKSGPYTFDNPILLIFYLFLALIVFLSGRLYIEVFYFVRDHVFQPLKISKFFKPALGGLMLGLLALLFSVLTSPEHMGAVYGAGYGYLQLAIDNRLPIRFMIILALFKIIATSFTIGSGGSGGVFGPSIVIGGLVGGAWGHIGHHFFPQVVTSQAASAFALVGMAGFFAGVANVPVSAMLMVSEMTAGYALLVPLMLVTAVAYSLSPRHRSIYENQVFSRGDSPAHTGDFVTDMLQSITVREVLCEKAFDIFEERMTLREMLVRVGQSRQICFPVVDQNGNLSGIISLDDIRGVFMEPDLGRLIIAHDMARPDVVKIIDTETLNLALRKFVDADCGELPVVSLGDENKIIGMLSRRDLIVAYNQKMQEQDAADLSSFI